MAETQDLAELEMAFAKDPASAAFIPLTQAYLSQGRFMEAMVVCKKGIKSQPDNIEGRLLLARVYAEQGKVPKAIEEVKALLEQKPDAAAAHFFYGQMLDKSGKAPEAIEAWKEALRRDRNFADASAALKAKGVDWSPGPSPEEIAAAEAARRAEEEARARAEAEARARAEAAAAAAAAAASPATPATGGMAQPRPRPAPQPSVPPGAFPAEPSYAGAYGMFSGPVPVADRKRLGPGFTFGLAALLLLVVVGFIGVLKIRQDRQNKIYHAMKAATDLTKSDTTAGYRRALTKIQEALEVDDGIDIALGWNAFALSVLAVQRGDKELDQKAKDATAKAAKKAKKHVMSVAAQLIQARAEGRAEEALALAKELGEEAQLPIPVRVQVGRTYAALGRVQDMTRIAETLKDTSDPMALCFVGESYRRTGATALARQSFDAVMKNELDHDPGRAMRALTILEADDTVYLNIALDDLNTLKELGKDAVGTRQRGYASLGLAVLGERLGRAQAENKRELEAARGLLRTDPEIPFFEAKQALDAKEFDRAISQAEEAIKIDKVRLAPYLLVSEAASRAKKWSKADEALRNAEQVFGDNLYLGLAKAQRLRDEEQYDKAVDSLKALLGKFDVAEVYRDIGKVYMAKGDLVKAIEFLKEGAKKAGVRSPSVQANTFTWLGRALAKNDQHNDAIEAFGQALSASAEHTSTYYWMAVSQKASGNGAEAKKACASYLQRDPRGPYADACKQYL